MFQLNRIPIGYMTVVIDNVRNPSDFSTSSFFTVSTLFKEVLVSSNSNFGRTPFTPTPTQTTGAIVQNFENKFIEQGSSWTFSFTLTGSYAVNHTLRFVYP